MDGGAWGRRERSTVGVFVSVLLVGIDIFTPEEYFSHDRPSLKTILAQEKMKLGTISCLGPVFQAASTLHSQSRLAESWPVVVMLVP